MKKKDTKRKEQETEFLNAMSKDPSNWKGVFYFNRKDPRLVVPKYNPKRGYTFNFANLNVYLIIAGFILIMIIARYLK